MLYAPLELVRLFGAPVSAQFCHRDCLFVMWCALVLSLLLFCFCNGTTLPPGYAYRVCRRSVLLAAIATVHLCRTCVDHFLCVPHAVLAATNECTWRAAATRPSQPTGAAGATKYVYSGRARFEHTPRSPPAVNARHALHCRHTETLKMTTDLLFPLFIAHIAHIQTHTHRLRGTCRSG